MTTSAGQPLVSVVCLCYNQKETVAGALEGVLMQKTDFPFELIVHDDASTDGTAEIVRAYAERYPDIIVPVLQTVNQYRLCNIAETHIAPLLRGRYVAVCEGDDYWTDPEKLARQVALMEAHPEATLCFHAVTELSFSGETRVFRPVKQTGPVPSGQVLRRGGMFCPTVSLLFRRDIADQWPAFRKAADVYDYPLQALAAAQGTVYYIDRVMGVYRFAGAGSWTAQHKNETDLAHVENETRWLELFNEETGGRFAADIRFHLAHLWLTEYRKAFAPAARKKARGYARLLPVKQRLAFEAALLFFGVFRNFGNAVFARVKSAALK